MIALVLWIRMAEGTDCASGDCFELCRVKYEGSRSFFNSSDGNCYPVVSCADGEVYVYGDNSCWSYTDPPAGNGTTVNSTGEYSQDKEIICVHGKMNGRICACDKGFYTSKFQDPSQSFVKMCDTKDKPKEFYAEGKNGEIYLNTGQDDDEVDLDLDPVYKVVVLIGGMIFSCFFSCCFVRKMKRKMLS